MTLTPAHGQILLRLARSAIASMFDTSIPLPRDTGDVPMGRYGVFVTLHKNGRLRGCIGRLEGDRNLFRTTAAIARAAAFEDPRFGSLVEEELGEVAIEVSVLSPLTRVTGAEEVEVGKHGVVVGVGGQRGLLLPQVALEREWDRDTFLSHACIKAGLGPEAWQDPDTTIEVFTAQIFSE